MSFMLETNESPLLRLEFAQKNAIGSDLWLGIFRSNDSIVDLVIDEVRLKSASFRCIEGEKFGQRSLNTGLDVFQIDPEKQRVAIFDHPNQLPRLNQRLDCYIIASMKNQHVVGFPFCHYFCMIDVLNNISGTLITVEAT